MTGRQVQANGSSMKATSASNEFHSRSSASAPRQSALISISLALRSSFSASAWLPALALRRITFLVAAEAVYAHHAMSAASTKLVHTLQGHKGPVNSVIYNTGSSYVLSCGQDRSIKLWNPKSGNLIKTYSGHGYEVLGLDCSHDNTRFASCGGDRSVFIWDVSSGESLRRLSGHVAKVNAVCFNQDSSVLASGSYDSTVRLWDIKSQNRLPIQILEESKDSITSICIRGHLITVGSVDGHARTYDLRMGELRSDYFDHPVTSVSISSDAAMLLVTSLDSTVRCLDIDTGSLFTKYTGHKNDSYRSPACFGKQEKTVVIGDEDGKVWTWDVETGKQLGTALKAHDRAILWTAHHPKEDEYLTASSDGLIKIWGGRR